MVNSEGNEFQAENSLAFFFMLSPIYIMKGMRYFCKQFKQSYDKKPAHSDFAFWQTLYKQFDHSEISWSTVIYAFKVLKPVV